jgi:hypothetical protein
MIIHHSFARNTNETHTCPSENPHCLSTQSDDTNLSQTIGAITHKPVLTHTNLVGILVIAVLLILGTVLWLCFGKWSKPIRHFLRREPRCSNSNSKRDSSAVRFGIGDGLATTTATDAVKKKEVGGTDPDPEKAMADNCSSHSSLDQDAIEIGKKCRDQDNFELAPPGKVRTYLFDPRDGNSHGGFFFFWDRCCTRSQSSLAVSLQASVDDSDPRRYQTQSFRIDEPRHNLLLSRT